MTKRTICLSLVLMLIIGLLPMTASAEESSIGLRPLGDGEAYREMFVSKAMLDMIKDVEGFSPTPYWDVSQWTIGYGSSCGSSWYSKPDMTITREEAEKLLLTEINGKYGRIVNEYCASISRQPNQQQFDALVDFTYNLGGNWTRGCMLTEWLENPTTELELVDAMGRWGRVNGVPSYATCMRRVREAIVFLKGEYYLTYGNGSFDTDLTVVSNHDLPYYTVVIYDCGEGEIDGLSREMSYHLKGKAFRALSAPVREGYTFMGWQVTRENSVSVSEGYTINRAMTAEKNLNVEAIWKEGEWETEPEPEVPEETEPNVPDETVPDSDPGDFVLTGTVRVNSLTIRSGPGSGHKALGYLSRNTLVEITHRETVDGTVWGETAEGWICLDYVDMNLLTGTVATSLLTIRSGAGTDHASLGCLVAGDRVEIAARFDAGELSWGRIAEGWICLNYVELDDPDETVPDVTEPEEPTKPEITVLTGSVWTDKLTIRTGPGVEYESLGLLSKGDRVEITELESADGLNWGKISEGWICVDYVELDAPEETEPDDPEPTEPEETEPDDPEPTEPEETEPTEPDVPVLTGTVRAEKLTIRTGPGAEYESLGLLSKGDRVEVTERKSADGLNWGKISEGWICLDYVDLDTEPEEPEKEFLFGDVPSGTWYRDCVEYVYQNGYMNGLSATAFGPNESMTRAMLVTVLYRLAGEPEVAEEMLGSFSDVSASDYFHRAVAWAKENGIVNGVSETSFAPNRKVTRQDAVTIFHRYFVKYLEQTDSDGTDLSGFADDEKVAAYAVAALEWAVEAGMISGSASDLGLLLNPVSELTRAQAAKLMFMLDQLLEDMV